MKILQPTKPDLGYRETADMDEFKPDGQIRVMERQPPREKCQLDDDEDRGWLNESAAKGIINAANSSGRGNISIDVQLTRELQLALSLRDLQKGAATHEVATDRLAENVVVGRNTIVERGVRAWDAGESERASEDEWEENGEEWCGEM